MVAYDDLITGPEDKHDFETIDRLNKIPPADWQHLIPELIVWLQDVNWPISMPVRNLLLKCPHAVVEPLRTIFEGEDDAWQYWTLQHLVSHMPEGCLNELRPTLIAFRGRVTDEIDSDWVMRKSVDEILNRTDRTVSSNNDQTGKLR